MLEEKGFEKNEESTLITNVGQDTIMNTNNDVNVESSVQNAFLYTDAPVSSSQMPDINTAVEDTTQNIFAYDSESVTEVPVVEVSQNIETVEPNVESVTQVEKVVEKNNSQVADGMDKDLKGNLMFIVVFAIIMIAIIIALPYISGYN